MHIGHKAKQFVKAEEKIGHKKTPRIAESSMRGEERNL